SVGDADAFSVDERTAEVGAGANGQEAGETEAAPRGPVAAATENEGRRVERRRGDVDEAMRETEALRFAVGFAPIGEPGHRRAGRPGQTEADGQVRRA